MNGSFILNRMTRALSLLWRLRRSQFTRRESPCFCKLAWSWYPVRSITIFPPLLDFFEETRKVKKYDNELVELREEDLHENYVRGSGAGGQKVNKTSNCVVLKHEPTGLVVRAHDSRSQSENKKIARARLRMKLDLHIRGEESILAQEQKVKILQNVQRKSKAQKKLEEKAKLRKLLADDDDIKY